MKKKKENQKTLPTGWREVRLNNVASVKTGPFGAQLHQHDYVQSNGTPIITVEHLSERGLIHKNLPLVSDHDKERLNQYLIQEGDIVFSRVGSVDRSTLVSKDEDGWLFSGRLLRVRPKNYDVHSSYLNYFFHTQKFRHHMQSIAVGGTMPSINTSILSNVIIHLPPMNEQKAIAALLETWDTAIEKTEALIAAKEKRFQRLLKTLLSDQQDGLEWKRVKLGEILKESRLPDIENNPQKRLAVKLHLKGVAIREYRGTESADATYYFTRKTGQLIYGKQNIYRGSIGIVPEHLDGYSSSQDIPAFDVSGEIDVQFLYFYMSRELFYKRLEAFSTGTGSKRLHPKELFKISIRLPDIDTQKLLAKSMIFAQREIGLLKQLAQKYHAQKRGLMQRQLTGEWRLTPSFPRKQK